MRTIPLVLAAILTSQFAVAADRARRVIVSEETAADGTKVRYGCAVPLNETRPVLVNASATWSADEASVDIAYGDAGGSGGTLTLVLARDCATEG